MTRVTVLRRFASAAAVLTAVWLGPLGAAAGAQAAGGSGSAIEGTVRDVASGRPLPNAQVQVVGTTLGAQTGESGTFRIANAPVGQAVEVRVRLIGYRADVKTVAVTLGQTARVEFALQQSALQLDQVVVTGTGAAVETKKLGNTIATINVEELRTAPVQSPTEALAARVPGVSVLPAGGVTGQGARIRIRGNASLSQSNNPIIYIDGVRMDNGGSSVGGGVSTSRLDDIDPSSIERVEILKGAAAATLYGTEASNGVIQIFTKKGSQGPPRWTVDLEQSALAYPDRVAPNAGFARTQARADTLSRIFGQTIAPYQPFTYDVIGELWETGYGNVVNGSVNGGAEKATYFVAGRYQFEDGPFTAERLGGNAKDVLRRYQGTVSLNLLPVDKVTVGVQTRYTGFRSESPVGQNSIFSPYAQAMYARPDQAYCLDEQGRRSLDAVAGVARCSGAGNPFGNTFSTTMRETLQQQIYQDGSHFNGSMSTRWTPVTDLDFTATLGLDNTNTRGVSFLPYGNSVDRFNVSAPDGSRSVSNIWQRNYTVDVKGNWSRDLTSSLRSTVAVGAQGFVTDQKSETGSNRNFPGPGIEVVGGGNQPDATEGLIRVVNAGYFADARLDIRNWIFANAGGRYDYNSAFGQSAGGIFYPKVSLSVVPSDRQGWNSTLLSQLRLRAALGRAGRQPGAFDQFTTYRPIRASTGGGIFPDNLGNADLKPEISTEIEAGLEAGLFSNRVSVSATQWNRTLKDALVPRLFAPSGGFTNSQLVNIGEMKARGLELGVNGQAVNRANVGVDLFANGSYLWQKVTSLGGAPPIKVAPTYVRIRGFIREGYAPGALFGAKLMAPCGSYADPATNAKGGCLQAGQTVFDLDGNGRPDSEAEVRARLANPLNPTALTLLRADDDGNGDLLDHYQGKPMPDWSGAFGANLRLGRSWRVNSLFEYRTGFTVTNLTDAFRQASPAIGRNRIETARIEATLLNPASTAEQRYAAANDWLNHVALSPYDGVNQNDPGDFIRWRELSVSYTASPRLASRVGARDMTLVLATRNLMLWTRYPGTDPEINENGVSSSLAANQIDNNFYESSDTFGLPMPRRLSLSVRLGY